MLYNMHVIVLNKLKRFMTLRQMIHIFYYTIFLHEPMDNLITTEA